MSRLSPGDKIAFTGVIVTAATLIISVTVPEVRRAIRLEAQATPPPVLSVPPASIVQSSPPVQPGSTLSLDEAKKLAKQQEHDELNQWDEKYRAKHEAELLQTATALLEQGKVTTLEEAKKLAKQQEGVKLRQWEETYHAKHEAEIRQKANELLNQGRASTLEDAEKLVKQQEHDELNRWDEKYRAKHEAKLLQKATKLMEQGKGSK